jgi:hypothetical protein
MNMKLICYSVAVLFVSVSIGSCKKSSGSSGLSSFNLINAYGGAPSVYVYYTATDTAFYNQQAILSPGSSLESGLPAGTNPLALYNTADTVKPLFEANFQLTPGKSYSLFLSGINGLDTLFVQDIIPVYTDSSAGARFVNLCPDCGAVNISLQGNTQNEFSSLAYKQVTAFKPYSDNSVVMNNGGYNYVVNDGLGNTVANFNWNPQVFKNNTLVIFGVDSLQTVQVFQVNNY